MNRAADKHTERTMKRDKTNVRSTEPIIKKKKGKVRQDSVYVPSNLFSPRSFSLFSYRTRDQDGGQRMKIIEMYSFDQPFENRVVMLSVFFFLCVANPVRCAIIALLVIQSCS